MTTFSITYFVNTDTADKGFIGRLPQAEAARTAPHLEVTTIEVDVRRACADKEAAALSLAFYRLNRVTDDNYDPALDTRRAPSASVGDVFVVRHGDAPARAHRIAAFGFDLIPEAEWAAVPTTRPAIVADALVRR
jgi:hypothetical protein